MPAQDQHLPYDQKDIKQEEEYSFDKLAKSLSSGSLTRGDALKLLGASLLASVFDGSAIAALLGLSTRQAQAQGTYNYGGSNYSYGPYNYNYGGYNYGSGSSGRGGVCPTGQTLCVSLTGALCTNLQTDANNCGACGHTCSSGQTCQAGTCTAPICLTGQPSPCFTECQCPQGYGCVPISGSSNSGCLPICTGREFINCASAQEAGDCACPPGTTCTRTLDKVTCS